MRALAAFALAVAVNTASVAVEQRWHVLTRRFGRNAWYVHLALVTPGYLCLMWQLVSVGRRVRWQLPPATKPAGAVATAIGAVMWLDAYRRLGGVRVANGDVFGRVPAQQLQGGLFGWLADPMYVSYALMLAGAGLWTRNPAYLGLAAESLALLNGLEASVENRRLTSADLT